MLAKYLVKFLGLAFLAIEPKGTDATLLPVREYAVTSAMGVEPQPDIMVLTNNTGSSAFDRLLDSLEKAAYNIDQDHPPYNYDPWFGEPTCMYYIMDCSTTYFSVRNTLKSIRSVRINYRSTVDAQVVNDGTEEVTVTSSVSHAEARGTSSTWTIGGEISIGAGGDIQGSGKITASYSDTSTTETREETRLDITMKCPPGKTCTIETVTFQLAIDGLCSHEPVFNCENGPEPICARDDWVCSQREFWNFKTCPGGPDSTCHVDVQLRDQAQKLLKTVILTQQ